MVVCCIKLLDTIWLNVRISTKELVGFFLFLEILICNISSSEKKWFTKIKKLKEKRYKGIQEYGGFKRG